MTVERGTDDRSRPLRVVVVGLAREGTAVARFLAEHGTDVTVTDARPAEALRDTVAHLAGLGLSFHLGGHPSALLDTADVLVVSPGVPLGVPFLVEARRRGVPLSSETRLFARLCQAPIIGVTGSSGKTTTTALTGEMLRALGQRVWVGGNIGRPLIAHVEQIEPSDQVVVELSSFQLDLLGAWPERDCPSAAGSPVRAALTDPTGWSPHVATITNITPNHLDRHGTMAAYIAAKMNIVAYQQAGDVAVLNLDDPTVREVARRLEHDVAWFSLEEAVDRGAFLRGTDLVVRQGEREHNVCAREDVPLLGVHNLANLLAACAVASEVGVPVEAMRQVATTFRGMEHRLELVRERKGIRWYNDSIATSPERTIAALRAFDAPIVLLAGGRDKHLPWEDMARLAWRKARHVVLFGEAAPAIERALAATQQDACVTPTPGAGSAPQAKVHLVGSLERAVTLADEIARPGDVVLLSPGGTSFDAYADFVERGEHFHQLVERLE